MTCPIQSLGRRWPRFGPASPRAWPGRWAQAFLDLVAARHLLPQGLGAHPALLRPSVTRAGSPALQGREESSGLLIHAARRHPGGMFAIASGQQPEGRAHRRVAEASKFARRAVD